MHTIITRAVLTALLLCTALAVPPLGAMAQETAQNPAQAPASPAAPQASPDNLSDVENWIRDNLGQEQAPTGQCGENCPDTMPDAMPDTMPDTVVEGQALLFADGGNATGLNRLVGPALIDFSAWKARAVGSAPLPADSVNPARDKALAQRTAAVEARKHLLQALLDLPLDGSRSVAQALAGQNKILAELRGLVQNSRLTTQVTDPALGRDGSCTALAELDLPGPVAERLAPVAEAFQTGLPFQVDMASGNATQGAAPLADAAYRQSLAELGGYTGVVVDARGLGVVPALLPRIMDRDGLGAYGPFLASREAAVSRGMAMYALERSDPRLAGRVGADPLWVRAVGVAGDPACDLVVSVEDGALIRKVFEQQQLRDAGALAILLD